MKGIGFNFWDEKAQGEKYVGQLSGININFMNFRYDVSLITYYIIFFIFFSIKN